MVRAAEVRPDDIMLDVACGTGDVCRAFASARPTPSLIVGADFAARMLRLARTATRTGIRWYQADALALPFANASFSLVTCAFGIRNFQSLDDGLREMYRVLRPGGRAVILEFSLPTTPLFRAAYHWYFTRLMPLAATILAQDRCGAYRYLPRSVLCFQGQSATVSSLQRAGFAEVEALPRSLGVVTLFRARK